MHMVSEHTLCPALPKTPAGPLRLPGLSFGISRWSTAGIFLAQAMQELKTPGGSGPLTLSYPLDTPCPSLACAHEKILIKIDDLILYVFKDLSVVLEAPGRGSAAQCFFHHPLSLCSRLSIPGDPDRITLSIANIPGLLEDFPVFEEGLRSSLEVINGWWLSNPAFSLGDDLSGLHPLAWAGPVNTMTQSSLFLRRAAAALVAYNSVKGTAFEILGVHTRVLHADGTISPVQIMPSIDLPAQMRSEINQWMDIALSNDPDIPVIRQIVHQRLDPYLPSTTRSLILPLRVNDISAHETIDAIDRIQRSVPIALSS